MDHTIALIRRAHEGDENARAQLVEENTGLIWCVVKRFYGRGTEAEDLFQIGSIGLLKAIDKFDLGYDVKFSTYAVPMITGEIKRFLRDDGMLKVSRSLKEIAYKAYQAKEALTEKLGREPLLEEIAEETGVEKEELVMAMEAAGEVESLHRPVGMKDGNEVMLLEKIADTGGAEEKILDHLLLTELIKELKKDGIVIMCGDGINDSISLVTADIGVSISSGTDIAMDSASVILMNDNIEKINELIEISEKTIKNIKQNLFWAFFYNICMIPIACGILENIGIEMNPMVAAFAMTISSLTVVLNALRLKK